MDWQYVEAECDCPHSIDVFRAFTVPGDVDYMGEAKQMVHRRIEQHVEDNQHCSWGTVDKSVYWQNDW